MCGGGRKTKSRPFAPKKQNVAAKVAGRGIIGVARNKGIVRSEVSSVARNPASRLRYWSVGQIPTRVLGNLCTSCRTATMQAIQRRIAAIEVGGIHANP